MPTYNDVNYRTLPQQVEKNRTDILDLISRKSTWFTTQTNIELLTQLPLSSIIENGLTPKVGDVVIGGDAFVGTITALDTTNVYITIFTRIESYQFGLESDKYKILACVIRNDGNGWDFVGGDHEPINILSIEQTGVYIKINYSFTASKVSSLVCTPDEAMASDKMFVGASVGLEYALIYLYQNKSQGGYAYYNGSAWVGIDDGACTFSWNAGILTITHPAISGVKASAVNRAGEYICAVGAVGSTTTEIKFFDYAGTLVTTQASNMRVYWNRNSEGDTVDPADYTNPNGNIWIFGLMKTT